MFFKLVKKKRKRKAEDGRYKSLRLHFRLNK